MGISKGYISELQSSCSSSHFSQANILIKNDGRACLADFSLLAMASDQSTFMPSCVEGGTIQWMSPELIDPESFGLTETRPTKESDCYALGMVIYEVLSGQTPFSPWNAFLVTNKVLQRERPKRPEGYRGARFTGDIWGTLELCWKHEPGERTSVNAVLLCLEGASSLPRPDVGGIVESDTHEQPYLTTNDSGVFFPFRLRSRTHLQPPLWYNRFDDYAR